MIARRCWLYAALIITLLKGTQIIAAEGDDTLVPAPPQEKDNVVELNISNFEKLTRASSGQTNGKWFVMLHSDAEWECPLCDALKPTWSELSRTLPSSSVNMATIDAITNRDVGVRFKLKGLPTLILFAENKMYVYPDGGAPRDIETFTHFVTEGYKDEEGDQVPKVLSAYDKLVKQAKFFIETNPDVRFVIKDLEHIWKSRRTVGIIFLILGVCLGFFWGFVIARVFQQKKTKKGLKVKKE